MKVLIAGGIGFVGSHACEYFANKGFDVIALDNLCRGKMFGSDLDFAHNLNYLKKLDVEFVKEDIRNFDVLKKICDEVDVIIHTAAQTAVTTSLTNPRIDFEINALGTFNVLEAARLSKKNPTIVYCSTNKVYGNNVNKILVKELKTRYTFVDEKFEAGVPEDFPTDLCEHTPYGDSKFAGDIYAQDYARVYGLKTGVFRMSCIYGTRQFGVEDQGWVAWFTIATLLGKPITIYGDGKQVRDILYVEDLIRAYDLFIESNLKYEVFNIGGGYTNTLSLIELLDQLKDLTGKKVKVHYDDWRPSDQKVYVSNIEKIKKTLGWTPKISAKRGIKMLVEWINENKHLF